MIYILIGISVCGDCNNVVVEKTINEFIKMSDCFMKDHLYYEGYDVEIWDDGLIILDEDYNLWKESQYGK